MKHKPKVSVVMPNYNGSRFVAQAIASVQNQTYKCFELIIVDDHSTDDSLYIIEELAKSDQRLKVIPLPENHGVAYARNTGILEATGEYIALLDNDDLWTKDKLDRQLKLILKKKAQIAYSSYDFVDEYNRTIKQTYIVPKETDYRCMLSRSVISCSSVLIETDLLKTHLFDEQFYHEDYMLWMTLLRIPVKAVGDQKVLMHYRQLPGSRAHNKLHSAKERMKIFRKGLHMNLCMSCWYFMKYTYYGFLKYR